MSGDFGTLKILVEADGYPTRELWQISGDQGIDWNGQTVTMPNCLSEFQVNLREIRHDSVWLKLVVKF